MYHITSERYYKFLYQLPGYKMKAIFYEVIVLKVGLKLVFQYPE